MARWVLKLYRPIHHNSYAGLLAKEAWLLEKNTTVTIPWRPSKLKPMLVASSCIFLLASLVPNIMLRV